jgi:hypothetical protein
MSGATLRQADRTPHQIVVPTGLAGLPIIASDPEFLAVWASPEDLSPHQVQLDIGTPETYSLSQATVQ